MNFSEVFFLVAQMSAKRGGWEAVAVILPVEMSAREKRTPCNSQKTLCIFMVNSFLEHEFCMENKI